MLRPGQFAKHANMSDYLKAMTPIPWEAMEAAPGQRSGAMWQGLKSTTLGGLKGTAIGGVLGGGLGYGAGSRVSPRAQSMLDAIVRGGENAAVEAAMTGRLSQADAMEALKRVRAVPRASEILPPMWGGMGAVTGGTGGGLLGALQGRVKGIRAAREGRLASEAAAAAAAEAAANPLNRLRAGASEMMGKLPPGALSKGLMGAGAAGLGAYGLYNLLGGGR